MGYDISDKMEWTVIFILEFGRKFGLTMKQAFGYLSRYKAIDYIDRHYGYVHTQSLTTWPSSAEEREGNWHETISRNECGVR